MNDKDARTEAWNQRWAEGRTGWDLGRAPPVISRTAEALRGSEELEAPLSILVPGAGRGHDAVAWAKAGFRTTAVDLAPRAVEVGRAFAIESGVEDLEFVEGDVTHLPSEWTDRFELLWEQTCLCAIPPELRAPYLDEARRVLKPGGKMLALLWNHGNEEGPPYDMSEELVHRLIEGRFAVESRVSVSDSPAGRAGEWLWTLTPVLG